MRSLIGAGRPVGLHRFAVVSGDGAEGMRAARRAISVELDREAAISSRLNFREIAIAFPRIRRLWDLRRNVHGAFCGKSIGPREDGSGGRFRDVQTGGLRAGGTFPGSE